MSTYEELSLIVNIALLIVAILSFAHKKIIALSLEKIRAIISIT